MPEFPLDRSTRNAADLRRAVAATPELGRPGLLCARGRAGGTVMRLSTPRPRLWRAMRRIQSQIRPSSATWTGMREPLLQELCSAHACQNRAAIYHGNKPLCGKHALERLE